MRKLLLIAIVGFIAQLVDGSLGMAYGVTSASLLVALGTLPAIASASIHLAEVGTTFASGASHMRLGNVDWRTIRLIALPGGIAAFLGATVLSNLPGELAKGPTSLILFVLGIVVLWKFLRPRVSSTLRPPMRKRSLFALGSTAGFLDAIGGGGWGPVATPALLASGTLEPRKVVGSVDTSEFIVSLAASIGFLIALPAGVIDWQLVGALLVSGVIAAPIAATLVRLLPSRIMGVAVGGLIVITNARTLVRWVNLEPTLQWAVYAAILLIWATALGFAVWMVRREVEQRLQPVPVEVSA